MAVMFVDLDDFKTINDTFGHSCGDIFLKDVAEKLQKSVRRADLVMRPGGKNEKFLISRFGGDEFIILLVNISSPIDAALVAKRVLKSFTEPLNIENHEIYTSASIGISIFPDDGEDAETLLKNADTAMYQSKENSRNAFQFYSRTMNTRALERITFESGLRKALKEERFELFFQPKYDCNKQAICGAEALLRWNSPDFGIISPSDFIKIAEQTGIIIPLGDWVVENACKTLRRWQDEALDIRLCVNISAAQIKCPDFIAKLYNAIDSNNVDPTLLEIEITENVLAESRSTIVDLIEKLHKRHIKIAIDDFGTGYSSLSTLQRLPIDKVKVDMSFIQNLGQNDGSEAIVHAMIAIVAPAFN